MVIGIYGYAKQKTIHLHRYFGNMLLKGCIATPLARIAGSILQGQGFENSNGYYVGIGSVTIIISIWQIIDTLLISKLCNISYAVSIFRIIISSTRKEEEHRKTGIKSMMHK